MTCPKCGHVHGPTKCTGHNARGLPCGNRPIRGGTVCSTHGGSAPQVKAAAEQRQVEQQAEATIAKLWPGLAAATPVKDPVDQMERLAGALTSMLDTVGGKVSDLEHLAAGAGLSQLRGEVVLLDKLAGHLRQLLADMARLGIAERQVRLEEEQAAIITAAFRAALAVLDQRVQLLPADRDLVVVTFVEALGHEDRPALEGGAA